jgi:UDP-3-O-[3-hydroxymyristoyl] glucosamine N-acyltransferase
MTFIRSGKFAQGWAKSRASAALVTRNVAVADHDPASRALLVVENADAAMLVLLRLFSPPHPALAPGIHPTAIVDPSANIGRSVHIGPYCLVGARTAIGDGSVLISQVTLGADVSIGAMTTLHPGVRVLDRCIVGAACLLWPNVVIGADGFGYLPSPDGRGLLKIPHIGAVKIGDGVEIGACSCIDRGKFGYTLIGDGTKIDNHVQIAHNCRIGRACIICGMAGIAGSVTLEDGVVVAGHVGIADGLTIGARATLAAKSGVVGDVPAGETWFGTPAGPHAEMMRSYAALRKLSDHLRAIRKLEKAVAAGKQVVETRTNPGCQERPET